MSRKEGSVGNGLALRIGRCWLGNVIKHISVTFGTKAERKNLYVGMKLIFEESVLMWKKMCSSCEKLISHCNTLMRSYNEPTIHVSLYHWRNGKRGSRS